MVGTIYIAYTPPEKQYAVQLHKALQATGHRLVLLSRDEACGSLKTQDASKAAVLIVLLSPNALRSSFIRDTLRVFRQLGTRVVAVQVRPLPGHVTSLDHVVDATEHPHRHFADLVQRFRDWDDDPEIDTSPRRRRRVAAVTLSAVVLFCLTLVFLLRLNRQTRPQPVYQVSQQTESTLPDTEREIEQAPDGEPLEHSRTTTSQSNLNELTAPTTSLEIGTTDTDDQGSSPEVLLDELFADFYANPLFGPAPLIVMFENLSSGSISSYAWDFDSDGVTDSTARDPQPYVYMNAGGYPVTLTITGVNGGVDSYTEYIEVYAPEVSGGVDQSPGGSANYIGNSDAFVLAAFTASPVYGTAPLTVRFTNLSTGNIVRYIWDFNADGQVDSTEKNPSLYTYRSPGEYEVTLRVVAADGDFDEDSFSILVESREAPEEPIAAFTANPVFGVAPLVVTFTNRSAGEITGYAWDFNGDGVTDNTSANPPPYTYAAPGDYTVRLVVTGPGGQSDPETEYIMVEEEETPLEPIAAFVAQPVFGTAPLVVSFSNRSAGDITGYAWDFNGDGVTDSTETNPPDYTYTTSGDYIVTLVATGPGGQSEPEIEYITVEAVETPFEPIAVFTADPVFGTAPLVVTFTNRSAGDITGYAWDFNGDGVTDSTDIDPPPYTYVEPGDYTVTLVATGPGGNSEPETEIITVEAAETPEPAEPPIASFTASPLFGTAPLVVMFTNRSVGEITGYAWDFNGDGVTDSTAANPPAYTYIEPGYYTVTLIVTGPGGRSEPGIETIDVEAQRILDTPTPSVVPETPKTPEPAAPPVAAFSVTPSSGTAPLVVSFANHSSGSITGYAWDFNGDGVTDSTSANPPDYTYTAQGEYRVSLWVIGAGQTSAVATNIVNVRPLDPVVAGFVVSPSEGVAPLTVTFANHSAGDILNYSWDLNGDGIADSNDMTPPSAVYQSPGVYTISLTVVSAQGIQSVKTQQIIVHMPPAPVAGFSAHPLRGVAPLTVTFTNLSSGDILSYTWDFNGDGAADSQIPEPPPVVYGSAGSFNAMLVVTDRWGQTSVQYLLIIAGMP